MSTAAPTPSTSQTPASSFWGRNPWLPYVAPMGAYLLLTMAEGWLPKGPDGSPHPTWYPLAYAFKAIVVALLLLMGRGTWSDFRTAPARRTDWLLAVVLGVAVIVVWVGLDRLAMAMGLESLYPRIGGTEARSSFDPRVLALGPRLAFLAVRLLGLIVLVPMFEELFWRSFVMRVVIDPDDFRRVPVGRVTPIAALITAAAFASVHPEWLPALLTGFAWAWLLWKSESLATCVLSHAVANLVLAVYVLSTGSWQYW